MKIKVFAVIDTNVLISAAITKKGFPQDILELIKNGNINPIYDKRILCEYYQVFHYDKFKKENKAFFKESDVYDILYNVVSNGAFINNIDTVKETLKDNKDIPFFEVKMSSEELGTYLVTGNTKHFPDSDTIVTPKEMISIMNYLEKFVFKDKDYEQNIQQLKEDIIKTNKYESGINLLDKIFDVKEKKIKEDFFR